MVTMVKQAPKITLGEPLLGLLGGVFSFGLILGRRSWRGRVGMLVRHRLPTGGREVVLHGWRPRGLRTEQGVAAAQHIAQAGVANMGCQ